MGCGMWDMVVSVGCGSGVWGVGRVCVRVVGMDGVGIAPAKVQEHTPIGTFLLEKTRRTPFTPV